MTAIRRYSFASSLVFVAFACGGSSVDGPTSSGGSSDGGTSTKQSDAGAASTTGSNPLVDSGSAGNPTGSGSETCDVETSPSSYCYCDDSTVHSSLTACPGGYTCCLKFDEHSCNCGSEDETTCESELSSEPTWTRVSTCP